MPATAAEKLVPPDVRDLLDALDCLLPARALVVEPLAACGSGLDQFGLSGRLGD
jgi:hypothetical protein